MRPSRRLCVHASLALFSFLACAPRTNADTLTITSSPTGATVELDGVAVGTTPYRVKYPGGYFHKTKTVLGERLEHAVSLRVYKDGYSSQEVQLTEGPFEWVNLKGKNYGHYWLLKTNRFDASLQLAHTAASATTTKAASIAGRELAPAEPVSVDVPSPALSAASSNSGSINIVSDQSGADIYVDEKFVGQTPAVIRLPGGAHRIEVRSAGNPAWQRELNVVDNSQVTLHANLRPQVN